MFDTDGELPQRAAAESQTTFVLILSAIWFGCINSAREIVKELPIYLRERAVVVVIPVSLVSRVSAYKSSRKHDLVGPLCS